MATLKHISSKNADYGAAERYLTFEHDEFSGKEIRDGNGHLIPRKDYRLDTLLCEEDDFAIACMKSNLQWKKNNLKGDIKSHHYIISFDPRDGQENGLTLDRAQELCVAFCKKHFPGHQAIIVTHPDGHNHSGNIHTHIVINSLRIEDVSRMPFIDRASDTKAGMKHRCTAASFRYLRSEVMEMCQREGLYQIDLLNGNNNRVSEKEYRAGQRAREKVKAQIAKSTADGNGTTDGNAQHTKFETDKEKLRKQLRAAMAKATTMDQFTSLLLQQGITVKESRGRFSYLTMDRTKPITSRRLGDGFSKEAILARLKENAEWQLTSQELHTTAPVKPSKSKIHQEKLLEEIRSSDKSVQRMVNLEQKRAEGKGQGYINWGKKFNLKQAAKTLSAFNRHGFRSKEELDAAYQEAAAKQLDLSHRINALSQQIREKKVLLSHVQNYRAGKETYAAWQFIRNEKKRAAFYEAHRSVLVACEAAVRYFKDREIQKLPSQSKIQAEIEAMIREENELYQVYREAKAKAQELQTIKLNIQQYLNLPAEPTYTQKRKPTHE